ncbi:MAG: 4-(cytidine 5'-diphospho)-2-C-methyl-D-erythritol kinase [Armatimonadetes bacterium]|nr:4-(cytidine 5'-diphospho)-2-C-methyl-D-erythritol kinase [Armatimonadota bacterium]MDW8028722.1 4-(cytidine 5'-diphospho)-2-C-methyl-D-erythritol kinase [Armatimonadota bacterium]
MGKILVKCAAKVNLCLEIVGRRIDGYHDLVSLMTAVGVWDELEFEPSDKFVLTDSSGQIIGEDNIIWRAALRFSELTQLPLNFAVKLKKSIPVQAGLGGGSSDGAAILIALRRIWKVRFPWRKLVPIASKVGADVPFFLVPTGAAIVEGIGDILTPVLIPKLWLVLAKPHDDMPTQLAFSLWDNQPVRIKTDPKSLVKALWERDFETIRKLTVNAFENVIANFVPSVTELKQRLMEAGAASALMSGSGTTVFGIFFDRKSAEKALELVKGLASWVRLTRAVRYSIVLEKVNEDDRHQLGLGGET